MKFQSDYYYGNEAEQYTFYRIPKNLFTDSHFKRLSSDAKILYGLMLDRMGLSIRNSWCDEEGRIYIYYTLDEVEESMNCSHTTGTKLVRELEEFGLLERIKQGQGKPTKIYVKKFFDKFSVSKIQESQPKVNIVCVSESLEIQTAKKLQSRLKENCSQDRKKVATKTAKKLQSRPQESCSPDCKKVAVNNNDINKTNINHTDFNNIHLISSCLEYDNDDIDYDEIRRDVFEQISLKQLKIDYPHSGMAEEIAELMIEIMLSTQAYYTISGNRIAAHLVQGRIKQLWYEDIQLLIENIQHQTRYIKNIKAYLIKSLYNLSSTRETYYTNLVHADMHNKT